MPHKIPSQLRIEPLSSNLRKSSQIGAEVILPQSMKLFDLQALNDNDTHTLHQALFDHSVLVIRNQLGLAPQVLYDIAKLFDPQAKDFHSGGQRKVTDPKNILSQNNASRIPRAPQVTIIGHGRVEAYEGIPLLELKHVDHSSFHEHPLKKEEIEEGKTRPYRFHMDMPAYENLPGFVTSLHAIEVPKIPDQKLQFPDGQKMSIAAGATLFFSGARNYELLTPAEQEFARNTTVQYAPRAYEWIRDCKATADGLTIEKPGREKALDQLPEWSQEHVQSHPMVWENFGNGKPHLQILGCCVYSLTTTDADGKSTVIDDIQEVRRICHSLQSKVYAPENIFAHRWEEGDLVIFHNRGLLHSISGQLSKYPNDRRLMWQCSMASGTSPKAYK